MFDVKANAKDIGRRIKALRTQQGITQDDMAAALGRSRSFVAGVESGGDTPGLQGIITIADELKVPVDWLLGRKTPSGGPLAGEFIDDMDELAWVAFWRKLDGPDRATALRLLIVPALPRKVA